MIKGIVFGCWNTLFYQSSEPHFLDRFAKKLGRDFSGDYNFQRIFARHFMMQKHDNLKDPILSIIKELEIEPTQKLINDIEKIFKEGIVTAVQYKGTVEILKKLNKKYKLGLLSNTGHFAFDFLKNKYDLGDFFDSMILSYKVGLLKPDKKIFKLMIDIIGLKKEEVVMVGDSLKEDIEGDEIYGIKGILMDRENKHPNYKKRITDLRELEGFVENIKQ